MNPFVDQALFENRFWLQIMGDHSRFIMMGLAPTEQEAIQTANTYINQYDALLANARQTLQQDEAIELSRQAYELTCRFQEFKLALLGRNLLGELATHLPPTFFNHMINELEDYLRILKCLTQGQSPAKVNPVYHHLLWLSDAAGHAITLHDNLDPAEKDLRASCQVYDQQFSDLYLKAVEFAGFLRALPRPFPAMTRFNQEAQMKMLPFMEFLEEIRDMDASAQLLDVFPPLVPDHMYREECYYLTQLAEVSEISKPKCDPARPRME